MAFVDKDLKNLSKPSVTPSLRAIKEDRLAVNVKDTEFQFQYEPHYD